MTIREITILSAFCVFAFLQGCTPSSSPSPSTLATIAGEPLTAEEFISFSEHIPDGMKTGETPFEQDLNLLQSLIDKELLLREAKTTGLEKDPWFLGKMKAQERSRLLELFRKQEINGKIRISEEEMEAHYHETGRDRAVRFNGIMVSTRQKAGELLAQLESGADFNQLAVQHSVHRETGARGGDTGEYQERDDLAPNIAEAIFRLRIGEVTPPVIVPFKNVPHFCIFKLIDERPIPLESSRDVIFEELTKAKRVERTEFLIDSLASVYRPRIDREALSELLGQCRAGTGDEVVLEAPEKPIVTDSEGDVTLGEFVETASLLRVGRPGLADSAQAAYLLERILIPERTFLLEAQKRGLDENPEFQKGLDRKRQEILLSGLRQREVDRYVKATPEEARAFYDAHPEKFTPSPTTTIVEILVDSDSLAAQLKQQLLQSEYPEELALEYSARQEARHHAGRIPLNVFNRVFFREIYDLAQELAVGEVGGPVRTRRGYSVFKVIDRQQELAPYHEESQRRAMAYVKIDKSRHGYVDYVRGLRGKYPVEIFEDNLRRLSSRAADSTR